MKKIIASAGLVAVSTTGLQAAAPGLSAMETAKPWSISATLRGFYDDNNLGLPSSTGEIEDTFGFEVRPAAGLNLFPSEQTSVSLAYIYSMRWFEARDENSADHSHDFNVRADHRFSERYSIALNDSFVYAQEPDVIDQEGAITAFRTDSDAFRNRFVINFDAQLTELIGLGLGYRNNWYDYDEEGAVLFVDAFGDPTAVSPSRSGLLDRFEHYLNLDVEWQMRPQLRGLVGYMFGMFNYTGDEIIAVSLVPTTRIFTSEDRDSVSHHVYVGAEYSATPNLVGSARVGGQYTDYEIGGSDISPWVDVTATYTYLPGSFALVGLRHSRNATDVVDPTGNELVLDQETTTLFASVNHRITPRLSASFIGQFQRGTFNEGARDGDIENFLLLGLNLEYRVNPNWSTEVGYNFDRLDSDGANRSFSRNRIYAGVRATY